MKIRTTQVLSISLTLVLFVLAQVVPLRATEVNYGNSAFSTDSHFAYTVREQTGIAAPVSESSVHGWRSVAAVLVILMLVTSLVLLVRRRSGQRRGIEVMLAVCGASMLIGSSLFAFTRSAPEYWFSYLSYAPVEGEGTVMDGVAGGYFCLIAATLAAVVVLVTSVIAHRTTGPPTVASPPATPPAAPTPA